MDPFWTVMKEGGPFHARLSPGNPGAPGVEGFSQYLAHLEATGRETQAETLRNNYAHYLGTA